MAESDAASKWPLFPQWLAKNNANVDAPVPIENSFRNLEDPLAFIRDSNIDQLSRRFDASRADLRQEKETTTDFSKSIFKKVVSRDDARYKFGSSFIENENLMTSGMHDESHRRHEKKKDQRMRSKQKREELQKQFVHGDELQAVVEDKTPKSLSLEMIRDLDTPEFEEKYKNAEFFNILCRESAKNEKFIHPYEDISENAELDELLYNLRFPLIEHDSIYSPKSNELMFKADEELDFWRRSEMQVEEKVIEDVEILKRCQHFNKFTPTPIHLMDYAVGKIDGDILNRYFMIKRNHEAELKIDENDENLEEEYQKKKQEYEFLKELNLKHKTQAIAINYVAREAQTINVMEEASFDSYFQEGAKDLIIKLKDYNSIRDAVLEKEQKSPHIKTMLVNIGHEIKDILFRMLTLILEGESFPEYEEYLRIEDRRLAEKKILELIYLSFTKIKNLKVDGLDKEKILTIYLEERDKNDKMFELIGRMLPPDNPPKRK